MKTLFIVLAILAGGYYYLINYHYAPSQNEFLDSYLAKEANQSDVDDELLRANTSDYDDQIIQNKKDAPITSKKTISTEPDPVSKIHYSAYEESSDTYRCDGRKRCDQMHSCLEAKFFLANCPGVMMDQDRDGVPCESQWCGGGIY